MPTYEVEMNGKSYEVDAPSIEAFTKAYQGGAGQGGGDFLHPQKPAPGSGWRGVAERIGQYPRIFLGDVVDTGETLGKVAHGELSATDPEAIKAARDAVQLVSPAGEFSGLGGVFKPSTGTGAQIARRALTPGAPNPSQIVPTAAREAAQTAVDIGAPLPAGLVSDTPGVKMATQSSRRLPLVGDMIERRAGDTVKAAGNKIGEIAEDLSGGPVGERSTVGAETRQSLQNVIENNNAAIEAQYDNLRQNHIEGHLYASPVNTAAVLKDIKAKRTSAGKADINAGLSDVENFVHSGRSFNGMVRARSDIGRAIGDNFRVPNVGFPTGDMKRVYGAMSADMERAVRMNTKPGVSQTDAAAAFKTANDTAKEMIESNENLHKLLANTSDEGMLGNILNKTRSKSGNAQLIGQLRNQMPPEDFAKIAGIAIKELGHKTSIPGEFSLNQFATRWKDMSSAAKGALISDPAHRKALDDIAYKLGDFLKDADKYINHSATSGGNALSALIGAVAGGHIIEALVGLTGGLTFGQVLARPASASALSKWLTVARDKATGRYGPVSGARAMTAISIASRNLANNLPEPAQAEPPKREPLRVTVHPKAQDRAPAAAPLPPRR